MEKLRRSDETGKILRPLNLPILKNYYKISQNLKQNFSEVFEVEFLFWWELTVSSIQLPNKSKAHIPSMEQNMLLKAR